MGATQKPWPRPRSHSHRLLAPNHSSNSSALFASRFRSTSTIAAGRPFGLPAEFMHAWGPLHLSVWIGPCSYKQGPPSTPTPTHPWPGKAGTRRAQSEYNLRVRASEFDGRTCTYPSNGQGLPIVTAGTLRGIAPKAFNLISSLNPTARRIKSLPNLSSLFSSLPLRVRGEKN
eukprot:scaffold30055_cov118-Isochrysis_galbana.AAC.3